MSLLSIIIGSIIVVCIIFIITNIYLGFISNNWSYADGVLVYVKINESRFVSMDVKYEYYVNERKYAGKRISFMNPVYTSISDLKSDKLYKDIDNKNIRVYFSDYFPKIAVLRKGVHNIGAACLLLLMLFLGLFALILHA